MRLWSRIFRQDVLNRTSPPTIEAHLALAAADKRDRGAKPRGGASRGGKGNLEMRRW